MAIQITDGITETSAISGTTTEHSNSYGTLKPNVPNKRMISISCNRQGNLDIRAVGYIYTSQGRRTAEAQVLREDEILLKNQATTVLDSNIMTLLYNQWKKSFTRVRDL